MKQTLKIAAMLLAVAVLVMTGVALAQSDDDSSVFAAYDDPTETADEAADETAAGEERPLRSRIIEWLAPLMEDGVISEDQAEAVADTLADRLPRPRHCLARGVATVREAADFLEMTGRELVEALRDGATLAELAGDQAEALIDHLVGLAEAHLDQAVADGRITADEQAELLAEAVEHITDLVNGELEVPFLGGGPGRPGLMGRHGPGPGVGPGADDTADTDLDSTDLGA